MSYIFETNAKKFDVIFEVSNIVKGRFPHTGITSREGIAIMYRKSDENWLNIGLFFLESHITVEMTNFVKNNETYQIMIYGPIISELNKLQIEVPEENVLKIIDNPFQYDIAIAGGPISYGIGCTSVKSMFSNIIERKIEANVHHISFKDFNYLNKVYEYYSKNNPPIVDIGILEIDYFPQKESIVEDYLPKVISMMKQKCRYLIGWYMIPQSKAFKKIIANNNIKEQIYKEDIHIIDLSYLYDENYDMCVYNDFFVNDSGHMLIYKKLKEEIRSIAKWNI